MNIIKYYCYAWNGMYTIITSLTLLVWPAILNPIYTFPYIDNLIYYIDCQIKPYINLCFEWTWYIRFTPKHNTYITHDTIV